MIYLNPAYLTMKIIIIIIIIIMIVYCKNSILGHIVEASIPPQDVASYTLKKDELKMVRTRYNGDTGEFLGI